MTDIVNMQTRVPKPGLFKELLDEMAAKFKTIDRPGVLYFPVAHLLTQNPGITAAFPTTAEAADKTLDNSLESDPSNYWEYFKSIGEKFLDLYSSAKGVFLRTCKLCNFTPSTDSSFSKFADSTSC